MMATPSAKPCSFKASCRSFRRNRTASRPRNATSAPTRTATASSACSTGSSSSVASPPATTRPQSLSSASYAWLRCGSGCRLLSTGPRGLFTPEQRGSPTKVVVSLDHLQKKRDAPSSKACCGSPYYYHEATKSGYPNLRLGSLHPV